MSRYLSEKKKQEVLRLYFNGNDKRLRVISEIVGAGLSNSLSLLGDAASMSVDVSTYICNIYGEWAKNN